MHIYVPRSWDYTDVNDSLHTSQHQAITGNNADLLSIGPPGTNLSEIPLWEMHLNISSAEWQLFYLVMAPQGIPDHHNLSVNRSPSQWLKIRCHSDLRFNMVVSLFSSSSTRRSCRLPGSKLNMDGSWTTLAPQASIRLCNSSEIRSCAVIARSNIASDCTQHCSHWYRTRIRLWTRNDTP